mgnify:CR=1 FL=1
MTIKEALERKGYRIGFYKSLFYGATWEDGSIDRTWDFYIVHPKYGCSRTLTLEEQQG